MARPTVVLELGTDHKLARDLVAGGVFVPGCSVPLNEDCELVVRGGDDEIRVTARVVWVDGTRGVGLQLIECDAEIRQRIATLARILAPAPAAPAAPAAPTAPAAPVLKPPSDAATASAEAGSDATAGSEADAGSEAEGDLGSDAKSGSDADADADADAAGSDPDPAARKLAANMHERLRNLTLPQQLKLAHHGEIQERILLERMYSKTVWEALLRNPRLTGPEVSRIARMGTLPRVLIELILGNGAWLQIPEVRRALLSNPRLGSDQVLRVLRLMPKHELKLAAIQTAYPHAVREAARKLIRDNV